MKNWKNNSCKICLIIIILLLSTALTINFTSAAEIDKDDCTFTDSFDTNEYIQTVSNVDNIGGAYTLDIQPQRTYNFENTKKNQATSFKTFLFSPFLKLEPNAGLISRLLLNEFNILNTYKIKTENDVYYETSSLLLKNKLGHHFRIQLDVDAALIGELELYYKGRVDLSSGNLSSTDIYFYYYSSSDGQWKDINGAYTANDQRPFAFEKDLTSIK